MGNVTRPIDRTPRTWRDWLLWATALGVVTALMLPLRGFISETIVALAYLLVVLFAGARSGRAVALAIATVAFLTFNWAFLLPYGTLRLANPAHWLVLVAFLIASFVATRLIERSRADAVLRESIRSRDAVIASLSHDLRAPLTTIKALAHALATEGHDKGREIEAEADRLHGMVADVLDLSRLSSGAFPLSIDLNDAEDVVGAALKRTAVLWPDRTVDVHLSEDASLLFGRFDFANTLRILVNLLDNALKYSASDERVDVAVLREGNWLSFQVQDRGDGVSLAERDRIFEPFYRPPGVAPDVHGAGLGLSIARGLAEAQGGTISYAPRAGGGSVFSLRVPAADVAEPPAPR